MCGIAGYVSEHLYPIDIIKNMTEEIKHRGPDGNGYWQGLFRGGQQIALGH